MGKGLKNALKSQQSRLQAKERAQKAAHAAELKGKKNSHLLLGPKDHVNTPSTKKTHSKGKERAAVQSNQKTIIIPFHPYDKILLVGEGDFSFARALVFHPPPESGLDSLPPNNVTATAYDSEEECFKKYPDAKEIVESLKERGVEVLFHVDATRLEKDSRLKGRRWDRIVWNFPHAGKGITDQDRNILSNQLLILGFLRSAADVLKTGSIPLLTKSKRKKSHEDDDDEIEGPDDIDSDSSETISTTTTRGTVLITLRNVPPYTLWDVPKLAKKPPPPSALSSKTPNPPYIQLRSFLFHRDIWTGYKHRMTKGERAHGTGKTGEGGEDRTWEFCLRDC